MQVLLPMVLAVTLQSLSKRKEKSYSLAIKQEKKTYVDTKPLVCLVSKPLFLRALHHLLSSMCWLVCVVHLEMKPASSLFHASLQI